MKLYAFGDSFVQGDQDDFGDIPGTNASHGMSFTERVEYLKYNVSFVSHIARSLNIELKNYAERGSGNFPQLDKLWLQLNQGNIKRDDLVLFGLTTTARDRVACRDFEFCTNANGPETQVDKHLIRNGQFDTIMNIDYVYAVSILNQLSELYQVRIIKFNLFDNPMVKSSVYPTTDLLGYEFKGNTLIDILNDTWGSNNSYSCNHDFLKVPQGYEHLYTIKRHPSITGHEKIAQWWLNNVDLK